MARIQQFDASGQVETGPLDQAAYRAERTGLTIGNAYREGIGALRQGVDEAEKAVAFQETSDLTKKASDLDLQATQAYEAAKQNGDVGDPEFANKFISSTITPQLEKMGEGLNTRQGQALFQEISDKMTNEYGKRAIVDHAIFAGNKAVSNAEDSVTNYANTVTTDPTLTQHAASMVDTIAQTLPADKQDKFKAAANETIYGAGAKAFVEQAIKNPNATSDSLTQTMKLLDDPAQGFVAHMNPETFSALHDKLNAAKLTVNNTDSEIAKQALPSLLERVQTTGVDTDGATQKLIDNYQGTSPKETAVTRASMQRQLDASLAFGKATKDVPLAPRQDVLNQIGQLDAQIAKAGPADLENLQVKQKALISAMQSRDKEFTADPAAYVLNHNPAVQGAYSNFSANPTPQTFTKFAQMSMSEQTRLYPGVQPRLATAQMEQTIGTALSGVTQTPEGATQAAAILNNYQTLSGPYWTQLSHELFADKVINPSQYVAAQMFSKPDAVGLAQDLLRASTTKPEELAATSGISSTKAQKAAASALAPLVATLGDAANGHELISAYQNSLATLIQVKGDINAAGALATKMVLGEYQFSGSLRMPVSVNAAQVVAGTKSVLGDLDNHKLVIPPSYSGTGPADQKAEYTRSVQEYGHWATNSSGDGALLYDEQGTPVYETVNGQQRQVSLKFSDLQAIGEKHPSFLTKITGGVL